MPTSQKLLFFFTLLISPLLPGQQVEWASSIGTNSEEAAYSTFIDTKGNIYTCGYFDVTQSLFQKSSCGNHDIFLAKHDSWGNLIWARQAGSSANDIAWDLKVDQDGAVYVSGTIEGTAIFETDTLQNSALMNAFVAKYDSSGNFLWAKQAGGYITQCYALSVDELKNIYITGYFRDTAFFDDSMIVSKGEGDLYLAKYDTNGNLLWLASSGGKQHDAGYSLDSDDDHNIYLTGIFSDTISHPSANLISKGGTDILLAKYNQFGVIQWIKGYGGQGNDAGNNIHCKEDQGFVAAGEFSTTILLGDTVFESLGNSDIVIMSFDGNDSLDWSKHSGSAGIDLAYNIALDTTAILLTGAFSGSIDFEGTTLISKGATDIFLSKLDLGGNVEWVKSWGGQGIDCGYGIHQRGTEISLCGIFQDTVFIEMDTLVSAGQNDIFIFKFSDDDLTTQASILNAETSFAVYPNPSSGDIMISFKNAIFNNKSLSIIDLTGKEVLSGELKSQTTQLNLSFMRPGIYILQIKGENKIETRKLLIN